MNMTRIYSNELPLRAKTSKMKSLILTAYSFLILAVLAGLSSCAGRSNAHNNIASDTGWTTLFNGKDLAGWTELEGKTKFEAKDGMIIGTTIPNNPNSVLCTNKSYDNFILALDIKVDSTLNSGVQIRSHLNKKGEVYGYQIEVDPSKRAWSGGIYDCRRRGWMINLKDKPEKQKAFKNGAWNHYKIKFNGDTLESWINEIPIATLVDTLRDPSGFIGLQADGNKQGGLKVQFKNIRIKILD
jgi:hypothetical protein